MVDSGIKQYRISPINLPAINSNSEGYTVRYRIVSDDRNRFSHWSPIFLVQPQYTFVPNSISFHKAGNVATIVWDSVTINRVYNSVTYFIRKAMEYDIWVRWDKGDGDGDWLYKERIEGTSIAFPIPSTWTIDGVIQPTSPNKMSIEVYLKGYPIQRGDGIPLDPGTPFLKVYELLNETV